MYTNRIFSTALLAGIAMTGIAQNTITISGNDQWQFRLAKTAAEADEIVKNGFGQEDYSATGFLKVYVPSNWAVQGFEEPVYRGFSDKTKTDNSNDQASEGLYIRHFELPASRLQNIA
mgnify:CR=1 FL=1